MQGQESQLGFSRLILCPLPLTTLPTSSPGVPTSPSASLDLSFPGRMSHTIQLVSLEEREKTACLGAGDG